MIEIKPIITTLITKDLKKIYNKGWCSITANAVPWYGKDCGFKSHRQLERIKNAGTRLAGLDENCAKILEITQLEDKFDRYAELAEAVKSFA